MGVGIFRAFVITPQQVFDMCCTMLMQCVTEETDLPHTLSPSTAAFQKRAGGLLLAVAHHGAIELETFYSKNITDERRPHDLYPRPFARG